MVIKEKCRKCKKPYYFDSFCVDCVKDFNNKYKPCRKKLSDEEWREWYNAFEDLYPTSYEARHIELFEEFPNAYKKIRSFDG